MDIFVHHLCYECLVRPTRQVQVSLVRHARKYVAKNVAKILIDSKNKFANSDSEIWSVAELAPFEMVSLSKLEMGWALKIARRGNPSHTWTEGSAISNWAVARGQ